MLISRSWVSGRGVVAPWRLIRIAAASGCPIQIGRNCGSLRRLQQHDRLLPDEVERDPVDRHLDHHRPSLPGALSRTPHVRYRSHLLARLGPPGRLVQLVRAPL